MKFIWFIRNDFNILAILISYSTEDINVVPLIILNTRNLKICLIH